MVKTSLKILWRWFLVALSEHLSLLAVQLYHVRQTIFWLCQCLYRPPYYNTNSFFQRSFSHFIMHWWLLDGLFQFINNQGFKWTSFWSFIVSCCSLILVLPNIVSSEELFSVWKLFGVGCLQQHRLDRKEKLLRFLRIAITAVYFKDRNWISKTVYCISCSVVCKIVFCYEFPDIPDNAGKVTRRRRRRTQAMQSVTRFTQTQ